MLRKKDNIEFEKFQEYGFKYGTRNRWIYKTKIHGTEYCIYIDLTPCHNYNNKIQIECPSFSVPEKIIDKIYDLITAGLVEKC